VTALTRKRIRLVMHPVCRRVMEEECDESSYWMELLIDTGRVKPDAVDELLKGSDEILSLAVASLKTARSRKMS
jgi:hypothetical protein